MFGIYSNLNHALKGQFYRGITENNHEMVISCNSFVNFYIISSKFGSHMTMLYPNLCYYEACYKGTGQYCQNKKSMK